eukprot:CAMPEP_0116139966 /NCGR_PEP_ID=MMETSP0329-20121206/13589_1 /TAXON_ID=697910 /ORGANISM="Pseudo-nitzschia arenysensis, Strain B593" /LENGTH=354 /DNA_ID=CAMNT_0003635035 /DNA_START=91 /DNA_END=1155 /DNA_ORIENTATION=+
MASFRDEKKRKTQEFVTTAANDVIEDEGGETQVRHDQFDTKATPALEEETTKSTEHGKSGFTQKNETLANVARFHPFGFFAFGIFAGMAVAMLVVCFRRSHRSRRKKLKNLKAWTNEIHFKDECSSDNSSLENAERGYNDLPIDYKNNDWLGGVGFDKNEMGHSRVNSNPFVFAEKATSDSSSSNGGDDNDIALFNALNGDSPNTESPPPLTLDSPSQSPPVSPTNLLSSEPAFSPPTVSELFQNTVSSHWRMSAPPLSLGGSSVSSGSTNGSVNEELSMERDDLNKSLFLLNDQIMEQQRNLGSSSEKTRRQEITKEIRRLEGNKADVELKLKSVRAKIKANKKQRRKILMGR